MTDFHGRSIQPTEFTGDDGSAAPEVAEALRGFRRGDTDRHSVYEALAGTRVLAPIVALLGESEEAGTSAAGVALRRDKDSEMALVTLVAPDGTKAVPVFSSTKRLTHWSGAAGFPAARPVPVVLAKAAAAALQEQADVLLIDLGGSEQFEIPRRDLEVFATNELPVTPNADPQVLAALSAALRTVPVLASVVHGARVGSFADGAVLELGFNDGVDPRKFAVPLRALGEAVTADPLLRERLGAGLSIVAAPPNP